MSYLYQGLLYFLSLDGRGKVRVRHLKFPLTLTLSLQGREDCVIIVTLSG
jgi:hypothetical protein